MALEKGINSYVTVAEADAYFKERVHSTIWCEANFASKTAALITATSLMNNISWIGVASDELQTLSFPRSGSYFEPLLGFDKELEGIPDRVFRATCELALHLLQNEDLLESTSQVTDLTIDTISLTNIRKTSRFPSHIKDIIKPLMLNRGARTWWRNN